MQKVKNKSVRSISELTMNVSNSLSKTQSSSATTEKDFCSIKDGPHYWFKRWIKIQRIFGITYWGSSGYKGKISSKKKSLLIGFDLLTTFALSVYFIYYYIMSDNSFFDTISEKIIIRVIIKIGSIASQIQYLIVKLILWIHGDEIFKIIRSFYCPPKDGFKVNQYIENKNRM